jgi:hypothetical protein
MAMTKKQITKVLNKIWTNATYKQISFLSALIKKSDANVFQIEKYLNGNNLNKTTASDLIDVFLNAVSPREFLENNKFDKELSDDADAETYESIVAAIHHHSQHTAYAPTDKQISYLASLLQRTGEGSQPIFDACRSGFQFTSKMASKMISDLV